MRWGWGGSKHGQVKENVNIFVWSVDGDRNESEAAITERSAMQADWN